MTEQTPEDVVTTDDGQETAQEALDAREATQPAPSATEDAVDAQDDAEDVVDPHAGLYDPAEHTVQEVLEHLEGADAAERRRIMAREDAGKGRSSILGDGSEVPVIPDPGDGYDRVYVSG